MERSGIIRSTRDATYRCDGLNPFGLACGCSVKVDLEGIVYPALSRARAELEPLGVRFNRRDDVDIIEGVSVRDTHLMRVVYRMGTGRIEAKDIGVFSPSRVLALFSVEQRTGCDVGRFYSRLLEAYSALVKVTGPIFVGKAHSILGAKSPDNEIAVFDLISTRDKSDGVYTLANNCTIRTIDPTQESYEYFQVAVAFGNSLNDLFCNGVHRRITLLPVFDMPDEKLSRRAVENMRRYCEEYGFRLEESQQLDFGEVMLGATVIGESEKRPPDFGSRVASGDLVLITRPIGELAILNLYLALEVLGDEFIKRLGASAEDLRSWRDRVVNLITRPNLKVAEILSHYLPSYGERFDPETHIKESTDISGPGIFAIDELARASGFSVLVDSIPLLNQNLVELAVRLGLMTNGTSGTNGAIAVIGSSEVVMNLQEELLRAGYEPSVIGRVVSQGTAGLRMGRNVNRGLISSDSSNPS